MAPGGLKPRHPDTPTPRKPDPWCRAFPLFPSPNPNWMAVSGNPKAGPAGPHTLRCTIVGKRPESSAHWFLLQKLVLWPLPPGWEAHHDEARPPALAHGAPIVAVSACLPGLHLTFCLGGFRQDLLHQRGDRGDALEPAGTPRTGDEQDMVVTNRPGARRGELSPQHPVTNYSSLLPIPLKRATPPGAQSKPRAYP